MSPPGKHQETKVFITVEIGCQCCASSYGDMQIMSKKTTPILYIKSSCPWCREALSFFNNQGVELDIRDVQDSAKDMDAMVAVSGQTKTPTFEYEDFVVADFSVDEFLAELSEFPEVRHKLGISDDET
jgi:glutaredoxin